MWKLFPRMETDDSAWQKKKKNNFKRVIRETISIMRAGNCVNMPSLTLDEDAKAFLSV